MAKKAKELGTVKRFGARYGRNVRVKLAKIEAETKRAKNCPYCRAPKVKRETAGIWKCIKCGAKFTGRAYTLGDNVIAAQPKISASKVPAEPNPEPEKKEEKKKTAKAKAKKEEPKDDSTKDTEEK